MVEPIISTLPSTRPLTVWSTNGVGCAGIGSLSTSATHRVIHLLFGVRIRPAWRGGPETSLDGMKWTVRQQLVALSVLWNGHSKQDDEARLFYFALAAARHVRVRPLQNMVGWNWSVAGYCARR
jgi:hypothetical protein